MNYERMLKIVMETGETAWRDKWLPDDWWIGEHLGKVYLFIDTTCLHPYQPTAEDLAATDWNTTR